MPLTRRIHLLALLSLVSLGAACTGQTGAPSHDSFEAYWQEFRAAVLANRTEDVAAMTRFPFLEKGIVPGIESVEHTKASFLSSWSRLMEQESGDGSSTMRAMIESHMTLDSGDLAPSGQTAQVGMFEFERTENGWRFTGAFLSD